MHRGQVLYRLGQTVTTGDKDSGSDRLCTVLLQGRGVQASLPVLELVGTEMALEPCNPRATPMVFVNKDLVLALCWWWERNHLSHGMSLPIPPPPPSLSLSM